MYPQPELVLSVNPPEISATIFPVTVTLVVAAPVFMPVCGGDSLRAIAGRMGALV